MPLSAQSVDRWDSRNESVRTKTIFSSETTKCAKFGAAESTWFQRKQIIIFLLIFFFFAIKTVMEAAAQVFGIV